MRITFYCPLESISIAVCALFLNSQVHSRHLLVNVSKKKNAEQNLMAYTIKIEVNCKIVWGRNSIKEALISCKSFISSFPFVICEFVRFVPRVLVRWLRSTCPEGCVDTTERGVPSGTTWSALWTLKVYCCQRLNRTSWRRRSDTRRCCSRSVGGSLRRFSILFSPLSYFGLPSTYFCSSSPDSSPLFFVSSPSFLLWSF